jgi:hypothetical protein
VHYTTGVAFNLVGHTVDFDAVVQALSDGHYMVPAIADSEPVFEAAKSIEFRINPDTINGDSIPLWTN